MGDSEQLCFFTPRTRRPYVATGQTGFKVEILNMEVWGCSKSAPRKIIELLSRFLIVSKLLRVRLHDSQLFQPGDPQQTLSMLQSLYLFSHCLPSWNFLLLSIYLSKLFLSFLSLAYYIHFSFSTPEFSLTSWLSPCTLLLECIN